MRQEGLQEQSEEEDIASKDQEQVNWGTKAETGICVRVSGLSRKDKIVMTTLYERE